MTQPYLTWCGRRNKSGALPHPYRPVCMVVYVLPVLSGKLQCSQNNDIACVFQWDLHVLEVNRTSGFRWLKGPRYRRLNLRPATYGTTYPPPLV